MRLLLCLYTALLLGANVALADYAAVADLRKGSMNKLIFHSAAKPLPELQFSTAEGNINSLSNLRGKIILINLWATWCAPCRTEMPMLSALQDELGGNDFEVLTIATGRNAPGSLQRFFSKVGINNLPRHRDPNQQMARKMGIIGLPVSVIVNRQGEEIARLLGDANWSSDSAKKILKALIEKN